MTFHISPKGVNNTEGTTAKFNGGGTVKIGGSFQNSGDVQIDVRANLEVLGNVVNAGTFSIKDYVAENQYQLFEQAINDLQGDAQAYLRSSYQDLKSGNIPSSNAWFRKFADYIKDHPELVTSSVQIVLQLFYRT
ncbi:MAG: hypothetical protein A3F15_02620 [Candidatus Wildermuthbacteria bacterium RIFCSPHIGHO2_12_FULL_40_12]|uniref:Uncharacterized protein n=1 Tax=Candidatus Wildermuthbacteria bacterium RIFCSPHIGHO2_12_FULL_40_12 TaxID=1802457 RepID=A0A1G2RE83_9BACT|nr:MAG: hypothetical protein A3F15_02620 [Candidatus Wildermuthbacteria bacterium RIFCSPHIGHO2_12_FULL_40_12]